jgi:ABC-type sulfate/molybdate transport systems ATPase subunit
MARPKLLLLDEPSLGLAPLIVKQIFDAIKELNKTQGLTVFLVEQNAFGALKVADRPAKTSTLKWSVGRSRESRSRISALDTSSGKPCIDPETSTTAIARVGRSLALQSAAVFATVAGSSTGNALLVTAGAVGLSTIRALLADQFPAHVASAWIGNSVQVAMKHYLQVTDEHFKEAVSAGSALRERLQLLRHDELRLRHERRVVPSARRRVPGTTGPTRSGCTTTTPTSTTGRCSNSWQSSKPTSQLGPGQTSRPSSWPY